MIHGRPDAEAVEEDIQRLVRPEAVLAFGQIGDIPLEKVPANVTCSRS